MKRRVLIFSSIILIIILFLTFFSQGATDEFGQEISITTEIDTGDTIETLSTDSEVEGLEVTPAQEATDTQDATPTTYDVTNVEQDLTVTTIPDDVAIETTQGTISSFSMTNALFSLGNLIQGSFISFSNNNNLFFSSIFDASEFTATLDEGGSVEVGQRNSFGDMGKVVVQIDGGNLTQDNKLTFIPNSNSATYTYYNTTEIEFKDGNLTYYSESITNKENRESSTASFDENGFTKIKLLTNEQYTNGDFSLLNTHTEAMIICKEDPFCNVNLEKEEWTIKGKVNLSYQGKIFYTSEDTNNEAVYNILTKVFTFSNLQAKRGSLSKLFVGHFLLTETDTGLYYTAQKESILSPIETYYSKENNLTLTMTKDSLTTEGYSAFSPENEKGASCYEDTTTYC